MNQDPDNAALLFRFFNEVSILAQLSGTAFERVMPDGMTLPQFAVLNHLSRLGDNRTPLSIARAMQVTKGAMTNTLGHLERAGYVSIVPDTVDRRSKRVRITQAGQQVRLTCIAAVAPELSAVAGSVAVERMLAALPVLEDVRRVMDARRNHD